MAALADNATSAHRGDMSTAKVKWEDAKGNIRHRLRRPDDHARTGAYEVWCQLRPRGRWRNIGEVRPTQGPRGGKRWRSIYMGLVTQLGTGDSKTRSRAAGVVVYAYMHDAIDMSTYLSSD